MANIAISGMSPKELRAKLSASRSVITETKRQLTAETKVLSFKLEADKNRKRLNGQVKTLLASFERYLKRVIQVGNKGVSLMTIVTPEVVNGLVKPFKSYLEAEFKAPSIDAAIERLNEKRAKDIENYGSRRDGIIQEINDYYDSKIDLYLAPLKVIEAQLNSITFTKDAVKGLPSIGDRVTKYLTQGAVDAIVVNEPAPTPTPANINAEDAEKLRQRNIQRAQKAAETRAKNRDKKVADKSEVTA